MNQLSWCSSGAWSSMTSQKAALDCRFEASQENYPRKPDVPGTLAELERGMMSIWVLILALPRNCEVRA